MGIIFRHKDYFEKDMARKKRHIAIIGLGTFGTALGRELIAYGDEVLGIDSDANRVADLSTELTATLQADSCDFEAMRQAGINDYDVVIVASASNMEASILATMNLLDLGCAAVWCKARTATHERIVTKLGAHHVFSPERFYGLRMAQLLHGDLIIDAMPCGNGTSVVLLEVNEQMAANSERVSAQIARHGLTPLALLRDKSITAQGPQMNLNLQTNDQLIVFGSSQALRDFNRSELF